MYIAGMDAQHIQTRYGVSRTTAWRAASRGWLRHSDAPPAPVQDFDASAAYALAREIFQAKFGAWHRHRDDLIQSGILSMFERSGVSTDRPYQWRVAQNAMRDYCARLKWPRETLMGDTHED